MILTISDDSRSISLIFSDSLSTKMAMVMITFVGEDCFVEKSKLHCEKVLLYNVSLSVHKTIAFYRCSFRLSVLWKIERMFLFVMQTSFLRADFTI